MSVTDMKCSELGATAQQLGQTALPMYRQFLIVIYNTCLTSLFHVKNICRKT